MNHAHEISWEVIVRRTIVHDLANLRYWEHMASLVACVCEVMYPLFHLWTNTLNNGFHYDFWTLSTFDSPHVSLDRSYIQRIILLVEFHGLISAEISKSSLSLIGKNTVDRDNINPIMDRSVTTWMDSTKFTKYSVIEWHDRIIIQQVARFTIL